MNDIQYKVYVDGSYNRALGVGAYAFIVVNVDGEIIYRESDIIKNKRLLVGHQVGCECKSVIQALKWCIKNEVVMEIYYDFANLKYWIQDIWGDRAWNTNTEYTNAYREYCIKNKKYISRMIKVKSHTGDYYNEMVDKLCGQCYESYKIGVE